MIYTHSPIECLCVPSSSSLLILMTLTDGLVSSEITMACRCSCETESSSQCGSPLQQFSSSSSSTCSVSCSCTTACPPSGHLASSASTTFFAVSAIFGDWHAKFWMFVFWEKLLPLWRKKGQIMTGNSFRLIRHNMKKTQLPYLLVQGLALLLAAGCGHTTCAMPMFIGWWVGMVIWLVKNGWGWEIMEL